VLDYTAPLYALEDDCLRACGELGPEHENRFESIINELLGFDSKRLVIDMTEVTYLSSGYVRILVFAIVQADKSDRTIVIRTNARAARILQLGGVDKLGTVDVVA
jgi:anti-anti-sigma factor